MKLVTTGLVVLAMMGLLTTAASAETCYQIANDNVYLKVTLLKSPEIAASSQKHILMYGNIVKGSNFSMPVTGAMEATLPAGRRIGVVGTNYSSLFAGNMICGFDGVVGSAMKAQCSGTASPYSATLSGVITQVSCAGLPIRSVTPPGYHGPQTGE